jgi:hypothetical protein
VLILFVCSYVVNVGAPGECASGQSPTFLVQPGKAGIVGSWLFLQLFYMLCAKDYLLLEYGLQ